MTGSSRWPGKGTWLLLGLGLYGLLLAASHGLRRLDPAPVQMPATVESELAGQSAIPADSSQTHRMELQWKGAPRPVQVVWREFDAPVESLNSQQGAPRAVLLLHGSPGSGQGLGALAQALAQSHRVLLPDLPGFGASAAELDDYSIASHALSMIALLDALAIERVHLIGYSMGGGVALELCDRLQARVASLTMLSSIGVQEFELLGDYSVNHAVHAMQLAGLWFLHEGFPHFGALDGSMLSLAYARNFYDTDQRNLRGILEAWEGPAFVLHGKQDPLVPPAAASEHARLLPQSRFTQLDGGHMLVFTQPGMLAESIRPFLAEVDAGRGVTRSLASAERLAAAARPFNPKDAPELMGMGLWLLCFIGALATLISEDLTCIAMGALVAQGRLGLLPASAACFAGIFIGDMLLFFVGRSLGRKALKRAPLKWLLTAERVERSSDWFDKRGPIVIFLSRFTPGARLPTYFAAGLLRTSALRFAFWFALAAGIWSPMLVWLSSQVGGALLDRVDLLQRNLFLALLASVFAALVLFKLAIPACTWRGRRLLAGKWKRLTRFEYWPRWVFYTPIGLHILVQMLRHRSLTAFTAVNPAMPASGVVGESKGDILAQLERVPPTLRLKRESTLFAKLEHVAQFKVLHDLTWPLVVKPDVGQRGDGVHVVRDEGSLTKALEQTAGEVLVQAYVAGVEFGLFYIRGTEEARGRLVSITEKRLPVAIGNGEASLEELILRDKRSVAMAPFFLKEHASQLARIPALDESVCLGELGTHCRGAIFLDGSAHATETLEVELDRVAQGYAGFHLGRFDVRAPSYAALQTGDFSIMELNGVTSEPGHIYDPKLSVWNAWHAVADQWSEAFAIGAANIRAGAPKASLTALLRAWLDYSRGNRPQNVASYAFAATNRASFVSNLTEACDLLPEVAPHSGRILT